MKKFLTILVLLSWGICEGQNLVPNPSFEQYSGCPNNVAQIILASPWFGSDSPDYFTTCTSTQDISVPNNLFGNQHPLTGNAYSGTWVYYNLFLSREYLIVPLISTLQTSTDYCVNFSVSLSDSSAYSISNMGLYFSDTLPTTPPDYCFSNLIPQIINPSSNLLNDTINWQQISGTYHAHGGEQYIIIGNFSNDFATITHFEHPTSQGYAGAYYYIDDVSVVDCTNTGIVNNYQMQTNIYPNPVTDRLNVQVNNMEQLEINLYDITSRELLKQTFTNTTTINTEQLAKGIYIYEVRNKEGVIKKGKVVKE